MGFFLGHVRGNHAGLSEELPCGCLGVVRFSPGCRDGCGLRLPCAVRLFSIPYKNAAIAIARCPGFGVSPVRVVSCFSTRVHRQGVQAR